jgi:hypothetical protein
MGGGQHELVFHPFELVAFARPPLQLSGHLVEGQPRAAVSERPPTFTLASRSPAASLPLASTRSSSGRRIEAIRPLKRSAAPVSPAISPAPTRSAVSRVSPEMSTRGLGMVARHEPAPGFDLPLVGAGGRVLVVLALLEEAGDADHRQAGEDREGDREADRQPVRERGAHPKASA